MYSETMSLTDIVTDTNSYYVLQLIHEVVSCTCHAQNASAHFKLWHAECDVIIHQRKRARARARERVSAGWAWAGAGAWGWGREEERERANSVEESRGRQFKGQRKRAACCTRYEACATVNLAGSRDHKRIHLRSSGPKHV